MDLKRTIYKKMVDWKEKSNGKTALVIEGARRVGKSTIAEKFGKENYKSYVLIDFSIVSKEVKNDFLDNINRLDDFYQILSLEYNTPLYKRDTLFIFDEIQFFPKARQAIKHLVKDGRYDFIETGSLISIKENVNDILIPSEEVKIKMYPLTFEEFLYAAKEETLLSYIKDCYKKKIPLIDEYHKRATRLFNEYIIVGGMPQSVVAYFENDKSFLLADREKRNILSLYADDIKKASNKYSSKVSALFENIPSSLSTHEKKIVLSKLDNSKFAYFSQFNEPLFWLEDSMICNLCYKCNNPNVGLSLNKDESAVKCYMGDTGLLVSQTFSEDELKTNNFYKNILNGKISINKGMFYENIIAQTLVSQGKKLFFYTHYSLEKHHNDIEIDFLSSNESKTNCLIYPIEVKSSKNYTSISYDKFKDKFRDRVGLSYIIHPKAFSKDRNGYKIPGYMAFCI